MKNLHEVDESQTQNKITQTDTNDGAADSKVTVSLHKRRPNKKVVALIVLVLVVLCGLTVYLLFVKDNAKQTSPGTVNKISDNKMQGDESAIEEVTKAELAADPQLAKFVRPTTGEVWYPAPKKIKSLELMSYEAGPNGTKYPYYEVGERAGNTIIMANFGEVGDYFEFFEKSSDGSVTNILNPDGSNPNGGVAEYLVKSVKPSKTIHYDSLTPPKTFTFEKSLTARSSGSISEGSLSTNIRTNSKEGVKRVAVKKYGQSTLVRVEIRGVDDKHIVQVNHYIELPNGLAIPLDYKPIATDLTKYTWKNGVNVVPTSEDLKTKDSDDPDGLLRSYFMSSMTRGCTDERHGVSWYDSVSDGDFVVAGKTQTGASIYTFGSSQNSLLRQLYKEYSDPYNFSDDEAPVSFAQFNKNHAVLAVKDGLGRWLVYTRNAYARGTACGKPVVYLYPTAKQQVSVRVRANVTVSDPLYNPSTGWQATAYPSGRLFVNGRQYDSLFWEGLGSGRYPAITEGTVVKSADAVATIRIQLKRQGLNTKEISDFMAFWSDKIPNDPYVRLTWFDTAQMDQLAPLLVSPQPDTSIRVFLDMQGYDHQITLPRQQLSSVPRKGFTLVEWGGLLQGRLH